MQLDRSFVHHWSNRYVAEELGDSALEYDLLSTTHVEINARGYLTSDELTEIVRWKSPRPLGKLEKDPATIKDVTRVAFARETPDWMRHHVLCILDGVRHPVASAILTVWKPEDHTVIDVRAVGALGELWRLGALNFAPPSRSDQYWTYLKVFRKIAADVGVKHRDLDRALWKWQKEGAKPWSASTLSHSDDGHSLDGRSGTEASAHSPRG